MHRFDIKWTKIDKEKKSLKGILSHAENMGAAVEIADVEVGKGTVGCYRYPDTMDIHMSEEYWERIFEMMRHYFQGYFLHRDVYTWIEDKENNSVLIDALRVVRQSFKDLDKDHQGIIDFIDDVLEGTPSILKEKDSIPVCQREKGCCELIDCRSY